MLPFECRGLMDPKNLKPVSINTKGKNKIIDGLEDPKCYFKYHTYECKNVLKRLDKALKGL